MEGLKQQASGGALQSRTPLVKSQTVGGPPIRPPDGVSCAVLPPTLDSIDIPVAGLFSISSYLGLY